MNKKVLISVGAVVIAIALFAGGALVGPVLLRGTGIGLTAGMPNGAGGPMANLTEEERAKVQNMSDSERQAFFQEKFGSAAPGGVAGNPGDMAGGPGGRGRGGQVIEGELVEVAADQITIKTNAGGSQTIYYDGDTQIAIVKGSSATEPAAGGKVSAVVTPEADNVLAASILVLH